MTLYFLDKHGWPVERFIGRPITNFLRLVLHTRIITMVRPKCLDRQTWVDGDPTASASSAA